MHPKLKELGLRPVRGSYVTASEDELLALEARVGASIPEPYRSFLRDHGVSRFYETVGYPIHPPVARAGDEEARTSVFYGIGTSSYGIESARDQLEYLQEELLPIGDDPGGNRLCIVLSGPDRGKILFWEHEDSSTCVVGESFDDFLANLRRVD